jgi:hypothetical protein
MSKHKRISNPARLFLEPQSAKHRQYEALRACFVEELPVPEVARRFGYTPGTLYVMCSLFRKRPSLDFLLPRGERRREPGRPLPRRRALLEKIIALRKQNLSIYDIARALAHDNTPLTPVMIAKILRAQGFVKLPRRADEERAAQTAPVRAQRADVRDLDLSARTLHTQFGGLFLFMPYLARVPLDRILQQSGFPGSQAIPALQAMLALLSLKLIGKARKSHVMSAVLDEGLALFAGLNAIPKRSFLTEYSCRIEPAAYPLLMRHWFDAVNDLGLKRGASFDLDFHTIPFHGEDALVEKHYVSKRSRRQKGLLAFVARDGEQNVFCYANAEIRKQDQNTEIMRFAEFWKTRTGRYPAELVFDSRLTTYAQLSALNQLGIHFLTLRRRSKPMVRELFARPLSAWRRIELPNVARQYRTPRIMDEQIALRDYAGLVRQIAITELGHEEPTLLLTNYLTQSAPTLITRYAQRMIIENQIADGIDFFHMDALSSAVAMKVNCDLQLTLMASSLYKLLACEIAEGYEHAHARSVFDDFVDATAQISISAEAIRVAFQKRAHNPYLLAAGFAAQQPRIPWLGGRRLELTFG